MSAAAWKMAGVGLAVVLLLALGAASGVWLAAGHYRPLLDTANTDLANAKPARDNLETLAGEQGRKLGELVQAGDLREREAALAQAQAKEEARPDYAAANRLLQERTSGDPALAASSIIDQELGFADGVGGVAGVMRDSGARGARCAGGGAGAGALQDAGGAGATLGSGQLEEGRPAGGEGAGAAG